MVVRRVIADLSRWLKLVSRLWLVVCWYWIVRTGLMVEWLADMTLQAQVCQDVILLCRSNSVIDSARRLANRRARA